MDDSAWRMGHDLSIVAVQKHTLALPEIQDVRELQQRSAIPFRELIKIRWGTESKLLGGGACGAFSWSQATELFLSLNSFPV